MYNLTSVVNDLKMALGQCLLMNHVLQVMVLYPLLCSLHT